MKDKLTYQKFTKDQLINIIVSRDFTIISRDEELGDLRKELWELKELERKMFYKLAKDRKLLKEELNLFSTGEKYGEHQKEKVKIRIKQIETVLSMMQNKQK